MPDSETGLTADFARDCIEYNRWHQQGLHPATGMNARAFCIHIFLALGLSIQAGRISDYDPLRLPSPGDYNLRIISPTLLELTLITSKQADPAPVLQWDFVTNGTFFPPAISDLNVTLNSVPIPVSGVGFKRRPIYAPLTHRDLRIGNYLYLRLGRTVYDGQLVRVTNPSGTLWSSNVQFKVTMDSKRLSPAIHVNQQGYMPGYSKKAMVGYYLGSLGELDVDYHQGFVLLNAASNQIVYLGSLRARPDVGYTYTPLPYQKVYEADFTDFDIPGEYRLQVPGLGVSQPFQINEGMAAAYTRTYALGLYHQRCGTGNSLPYTRHVHGPCHTAPAQVPTMQFTAVNETLARMTADYSQNPRHTAPRLRNVNASLYPFVRTGEVDVSGGHHDAGDYSKYTINSAQLVHSLIFALDVFPGIVELDNLGLPESGDGVSDVIQEAKWEADFLAKMQDADGGFYFLVYPRDREYESDVLPDAGDPQVVYPKNTAATAAAVAALAQAASSPAFRNVYPEQANAYLQKARDGWAFLQRAIAMHGRDGSYQKLTHYGDTFMHDDELAWAATEMYLATGDPACHQELLDHYDPANPNTRLWGWWRLYEAYGCAVRSYAFAAQTGRVLPSQLNAAFLAKCNAEILAGGADQLWYSQCNAYGSSFPEASKAYRTAGWYFSVDRAYDIVTAYQLQPGLAWLEAILGNFNYEGGCNPLNLSYVTGIGKFRQREIVSQYAQNDRRVLPPSGLPLGNVQEGFPYLDLYGTELDALCFPEDGAWESPYPYYDRWGDTFNTMTEYVVPQQGRSLATAAFLMTQTSLMCQPWAPVAAEIVGIPNEVEAGNIVGATVSAGDLDLSNSAVVWEARDQEPFLGVTFPFAAVNPGSQWVEAEGMLPDGRRVFAATVCNASFNPALPPNSFQSNGLVVSADLAALYHADNSPIDATGKQPQLTLSGNTAFDWRNVGWMKNRQGASLRFQNVGDQATVSIDNADLVRGDTDAIAVNAMIYITQFKARETNPTLLSLEANWLANLQFIDNVYLGPLFLGGTELIASSPELKTALCTNQWHHLRIAIDRYGYSVTVDGKVITYSPSAELNHWPSEGTSCLTVGNFDGWMDEIAIETIHFARPLALAASIQNNSELKLAIQGNPGAAVCVQTSTDLAEWHGYSTNYLVAGRLEFSEPNIRNVKSRFFRIVTPLSRDQFIGPLPAQ